MRILRVSHSAVVDDWRQRERELIKLGHCVRLLTARRWNEGGRKTELRAGGDRFATGIWTVGRHPNLFLYSPVPLLRALRSQVDVIDIHEEPYSLAAVEILFLRALTRNRAPYAIYSAQNIEKRFPSPFRQLEQWVIKCAAGMSVCNTEAGRIAVRKGLPVTPTVIPLGVDTTRFAPDDYQQAGADDRLRIGYVGRLEAHKGVDVLIRAIALLEHDHSVRLTVTGDGPERGRLVALRDRLGLADTVDFQGFVDHQDLPDVYRRLDLLVVPSLPRPYWLEQFCRVAVEAMASGVPVVASDSGALPDVVGDGGLLVPPGDEESLASAIRRFAGNDRLRATLRARAIGRVPQFSWSSVADRYQTMYRSMITTGDDEIPPAAPEIIVVAYGSPEQLDRALRPLAGEFPITVVDNSGLDATRTVVERLGGIYLNPGCNLGFAAGVNFGVARRQAPGRDLLLLNPDAVIDAESVRQLQRELHAVPRTACVGPAQVDESGRPARVVWPFPGPTRAWLEAIGLGRLNRRADFLIGSVLLINATAWTKIGGLDERFFLYAEETDWQRRATADGWSKRMVPGVRAMHVGAGTGGDSRFRITNFHASQELYIRKHFGKAGWLAYRTAMISGAAIRSRLLFDERRTAATERVRLYLAGPVFERNKLINPDPGVPAVAGTTR